MKKLLALLLAGVMAFSLAACGDNGTGGVLPWARSSGDGAALSTDFQQHMKTADWFDLGPMCETETGWYFQYDGLLHYIDKKSIETTILCGKPDCKHADTTCNAWVNTSSLNYSDGKVYFDNSDNDNGASGLMTLFSMNTDGTGRKDIQALQQQKQGGGWKPCEAIIHRGVVYFNYAGAVYMASVGSDMSKATKLYGEVINKESGAVDNGDGIYWKFSAEGEKIYFMGNITQSDKTQKDTLFCYDTNTKEVKQVWQIPDASEVGEWETTGVSLIRTGTNPRGWYIKDGALYFYLPGNDLWYNDLNSGKNERVAAVSEKIPNSGFAVFNDDNIFIINDYPDYLESLFDRDKTKADTIFMYDYDGNLLKELSLKGLEKHLKSVSNIQMLWASEGKLFMFVYGDTKVSDVAPNAQEATNKERLAYIDIETGAISLLNWTGYYG